MPQSAVVRTVLLLTVLIAPLRSLTAQAPSTISHQGFLTDTSGSPVDDATRSMLFSIYDQASGGSAAWSETQNVATDGGIFDVLLGSVTPFGDLNFNDSLWLAIKIGTDSELAPRSLLTAAPAALGLVMPFRSTFEIETLDFGSDGSESFAEDLTIRAEDANIGLYSSDMGTFGSGIEFGEIVGGSLVDKWSLIRSTTDQGAELRLTYGTDPDQGLNPIRARFDSTGVLTAAGFDYSTPDTMYFSIAGTSFRPHVIDSMTQWDVGAFTEHTQFKDRVSASVNLPNGAKIESITCMINDVSTTHNLYCRLCAREGSTVCKGTMNAMVRVESSGSSGISTYSGVPSFTRIIDNVAESYHMEVSASSGPANKEWRTAGHDIEIIRAYITYTVARPD